MPKLVIMILDEKYRGNGTTNDASRMNQCLYALDGSLIVERDTWKGETYSFRSLDPEEHSDWKAQVKRKE